jgi:uncharacterized GH25 family protein
MDLDTFKKYLHNEGLEDAVNHDQSLIDNTTSINEKYIRHAKVLIQAGTEFQTDVSRRQTGYDLEIIPKDNPYRKSPGDQLAVKVLFEQKPAADLLLIAFSKTKPNLEQRVRTDQKGSAVINLDTPGDWLLKVVKILPDHSDAADWKSHWASLTFTLPPSD